MALTASQSFLLRFSRRASFLVILTGGLVLLGWAIHVQVLKSWAPNLMAMNPTTAALFILCGIALFRAATAKPNDKLMLCCAAVIFAGGCMKVMEYGIGIDLNFDRLFFRKEMGLAPLRLNEIALNTAVCFIFCGLALLLIDVELRRGFRPAQILLVLVGLVALLALIGYGYRVLPLPDADSSLPMALNSGIAFVIFATGAMAARPSKGIMKIITSDTTGGTMVRRLLPAAVLIPLVLGWVAFSSEKHSIFDVESGMSLFTFANIVVFAAVIWWNARLLFRAEAERQRAIEKLKQTTEELERSNTELQQFASIASHDLSEPLRMVASYLELLSSRAEKKLDAQDREFIGFAVDGARRMQMLIQDLLAYARVGTRGKPLEPTNCEEALQAALSNLKVAISESQTVVEHEPLPMVDGDGGQLTQVFQNLLSNAIKFRGNKSPTIHVGAQRGEKEWIFHVRDNGIGIDPKNFDRIFVLFQRLHTRQEYPGTGIGLAVCKKIIERHGGRIWVESTQGVGTTFFFTIPVREETKT